jgi:hypothetical protein
VYFSEMRYIEIKAESSSELANQARRKVLDKTVDASEMEEGCEAAAVRGCVYRARRGGAKGRGGALNSTWRHTTT